MRLFISIQISKELQRSITGTMHELKKAGVRGNYVPAQNLHLTLAFIGETDDVQVVRAALQSIKVKPFRLSLSGLGTFGDLLWIGLKGNQGLSRIVKEVRAALDSAGIPYDRKEFRPHITVIRKMSGNWKTVTGPSGEMMVKKISLMRSVVRDGKRVYTEA